MSQSSPDYNRSLRDKIRSTAFPRGFPISWDPEYFEEEFREALDPEVADTFSEKEIQVLRQMFGVKALEQCILRTGKPGNEERTAAVRRKLQELGIQEDRLEEVLEATFGKKVRKKEADELLAQARNIDGSIRAYRSSIDQLEKQRMEVLNHYREIIAQDEDAD